MSLSIYDILVLVGAPAIISFLFQWWFNKKKSEKGTDDIVRKGLQALLRQKQLEMYHEYCVIKKWIPEEYKLSYDNMYNCYHSLGKNGVMDTYHDEIMALPTVKPKPKKGSK